MSKIGIMQGRLSPPFEERFQAFPADSWRDEFHRASRAGLVSIEWIFETYNENSNPVKTDEGISEMLDLSQKTGISVLSICADYYMQKPLIKNGNIENNSYDHLLWLIERASNLSLFYIVLPFVDDSSLADDNDRAAVIVMLKKILPHAEKHNVELHLETDLQPDIFRDLMTQVNHHKLRVNYDIGNSAALGYDQDSELKMLSPWLGSVHVKDRVLFGSTVPLGTGNADFPACFRRIIDAGYNRPFILQASRGENNKEVDWNIDNREFVERYLEALED